MDASEQGVYTTNTFLQVTMRVYECVFYLHVLNRRLKQVTSGMSATEHAQVTSSWMQAHA